MGDPAPLLHHLTGCLVQLQEGADEQHFENCLYALGQLHEQCGHTPHPEHLQGLAAGVLQRLSGQHRPGSSYMHPQGICNTLWACAKLRYPHPELLTRLAGAAGRAAGRMQSQHLSNSVWALGRLVDAGCLDGSSGVPGVQRLAEEVQRRVQKRRGSFGPQDLSSTLLGLAYLQSASTTDSYRLAAVVEALAAECHIGRGFEGFPSQNLANAAWALAKLGYSGQAWYAGCVKAALQPGFCATAVSQNWSNLWWALAQARHLPSNAPSLLERTADGMAAMRGQATGQECSSTLWALAILGLYDRRLVGCLLGRLVELLPRSDLGVQALSNAAWAISVMGPGALSAHVVEVGALLREVARRWPGPGARAAYTKEGLRQLFQAQSDLEAHPAPEVRALSAIVPGAARSDGVSLESAIERAAKGSQVPAGPTVRQVRSSVMATLQRMEQEQTGLPGGSSSQSGSSTSHAGAMPSICSAKEGVFALQVCRWVDVEVRLEGGRVVALMVHEPSSTLANQPAVLLGGTLSCHRQLQRVYGAGNVVGVLCDEWEALGGDMGRQEALLRALLMHGNAQLQDGERLSSVSMQSQPQQQQQVGRMPQSGLATPQLQASAYGPPLLPRPTAAPSGGPPAQGKVQLGPRPRRVLAPQGNGGERKQRG